MTNWYYSKNFTLPEDFFTDLKATAVLETPEISKYSLANPNGSWYKRMEFVMTGPYLIVTGDYGSAVFQLTEKASLQSIATSYDIHYLMGELSCAQRPESLWSADKFNKEFQEFREDFIEDHLDEELLVSKMSEEDLGSEDSLYDMDDWHDAIDKIQQTHELFDSLYSSIGDVTIGTPVDLTRALDEWYQDADDETIIKRELDYTELEEKLWNFGMEGNEVFIYYLEAIKEIYRQLQGDGREGKENDKA